MKKLFVMILCFTLLLSFPMGLAEETLENGGLFDLVLLPGVESEVGYNARIWMQNEELRAYFTCLMVIEYGAAIGRNEATLPPFEMTILDNDSYIGRNGLELYIMILSQDYTQAFFLIYRDSSTNAGYLYMDMPGRGAAEFVFADMCPDGYYKNDVADLHMVSLRIKDLLDL